MTPVPWKAGYHASGESWLQGADRRERSLRWQSSLLCTRVLQGPDSASPRFIPDACNYRWMLWSIEGLSSFRGRLPPAAHARNGKEW